jgi:hypothetical protein
VIAFAGHGAPWPAPFPKGRFMQRVPRAEINVERSVFENAGGLPVRVLLIASISLGHAAISLAAEPQTPTPPPTPQTHESLSEKLDKNKGVIKPPSDVDPGIARPAPEIPNSTPVIPPPAPNAK